MNRIETLSKTRTFSGSKVYSLIEISVLYMVLIGLSIAFLTPIAFLFLGSFKESSELFRVPFKWLPDHFQLGNYQEVFTSIPFFKYLKNTMIIVVFNIVGSILANSFIAYGFSKLRWPFRDQVFLIVLGTMILPFQVTMVPLFLMFTKMGWIGTFLPLTVTAFFGNPFFIFLFRQFYMTIPDSILQAARIDGANEFKIYGKVILPLMKPAVATVAIFAFIRSWNDFIGPLIFLADDDLYTLSLAAQLIRSDLDPKWNVLLALGAIMVLPVLLIYFMLQKYFIEGVTMSGVKG